jgi:CspA family cold shock protein
MARRSASTSLTGTIKRIVRDKGFGFVRDEYGTEYFFHRSEVSGQWEEFQEGDSVTFTEDDNAAKGPRAQNVQKT